MNLRDLEYLVAVARFRHFGRAAEHCNVSQPSLSAQIKKMEDFLGITLIERTNKRVMMTREGEQVLQHAIAILRHAEEIREIGRQAGDPMSGKFKLGIIPTMAPYFLPRLLPMLQEYFPLLEVELFEGQTRVIVDQIKRGELDAVFLALPLHEDMLHEEKIGEEEFYLAVPSKHKLAGSVRIGACELAGEDILLLEDGHCLRDQALDVCQMAGANEHLNARATSLETLRQMVINGLGITLMPKLAAEASGNELHFIPFNDPAPSRTVGLVWRKSSPRGKLLSKFADKIRELGLLAADTKQSARKRSIDE